MRRLLLLLMLAFPLIASAQMGSWTLYYSDTPQVNPDGSITITPTVSLTGSDGGGYCDPMNDCDGREQSFVMLNGNAWQGGYVYDAGDSISLTYTFPDVTLPVGASVDLSYAGKVEGASRILPGGASWIDPSLSQFYLAANPFIDGDSPYINAYAPCWIDTSLINNNAPPCGLPWVNPLTGLPAGWHPSDLDSQQVAQTDMTIPPCGAIRISAPAQSQQCNGTSTYHAPFTLTNKNITFVSGTSSADNILILELLGSPYVQDICSSPDWCMRQDYKAYTYQGSPGKANFQYTLSVTCSAPPAQVSISQPFACQ